MSINHIILQNEMTAGIRKKVQKNTTFLFPKIFSSALKDQYYERRNNTKKISSDKDLYMHQSNNKNNENTITNLNFYSMNPRDVINGSKLKSFQINESGISQKIKELTENKQPPSFQKDKYNFDSMIDHNMRQTQRAINKLRSTFIARKSENTFEYKQILANHTNVNNNAPNNKRTVGNYFVLKQLGHGGFAKVYEVMHKESNKKFAMKQYILTESLQCFQKQVKVGQFYFKDGQIRTQMFQQKGTNSVIKYVQKIRSNKKGYIFQQLGGQNFSKLLSEIKGTFHNKERVYEVQFLPFYDKMKNRQFFISVMTQICEGIQLLNQTGFVHCDLKLENVLVDYDDKQSNILPKVKIIDFGSTFQISKGLPKITITPEYMPPELLMQFDKNGHQGPQLIYEKIDVWSVGCILLEIFTGVPLWFRYKCKFTQNQRSRLELSLFALTNRDYGKIIKKQHQLCENLVKSIGFVSQQWQKYRSLLKEIFVINPEKRISIEEIIQRLKQIK